MQTEVQLNKVMSDDYGAQTAETYEETLLKYAFGYREVIDAIVHEVIWVQRFLEKSELRILDLGAGTGLLSRSIEREIRKLNKVIKLEFLLTDRSEEMLEKAKVNWPKSSLSTMKTEKLSFEETNKITENFDIVMSTFAIHHLNSAEKQELFQNTFKLVKKGGVFIIGDRMVDVDSRLYSRHLSAFAPQAKPLFEKLTGRSLSVSESAEEAHKQFVADGDKPEDVDAHRSYLRSAGFSDTCLSYYNFGFAVVSATKSERVWS